MLNVVVVGAGAIGSSLAFRLAEAGARVTVVDGALPAGGATGNSLAWVNALSKRPADYFTLNMEGMAAHQRLVDLFGQAPWWNGQGVIYYGKGAHLAASEFEWAQERGYGVERKTRAEIAVLEPDLTLPAEVEHINLYPDEGFLHTHLFVAHMLQAARTLGASVRLGETVEALVTQGDRVTGVRTTAGDVISGDEVIVAAGMGSVDLLGGIGCSIPITRPGELGDNGMQTERRPLGLLVVTGKTSTTLRRLVKTDDVQFRPDGAGRVLLQLHSIEYNLPPDLEATPLPHQAWTILDRGRPHLRSLKDADVAEVYIGNRVMPDDGMPVVGRLPRWQGVYAAIAHSGITLSPIIAELATQEVSSDHTSDLLTTFRPDRFGSASPFLEGQ